MFKSLKCLIVVSILLATLASATPVDQLQQNEPSLTPNDASISTASPLEAPTTTLVTAPEITDTQVGNESPKTESPTNLEAPTSEDLTKSDAGSAQLEGVPTSTLVPATATAQPSSEDAGIDSSAATTTQTPPNADLSTESAEKTPVVASEVTTSPPANSGSSPAAPLIEQPLTTTGLSPPSTEAPTSSEVPTSVDLTNNDAGSSSDQQAGRPTATLVPEAAPPAATTPTQPSVEDAGNLSQRLPATTTITTMAPPVINLSTEPAQEVPVTTAEETLTSPTDSVVSSPIDPLPPQTERHSTAVTSLNEPETAAPSSPEIENAQPTTTLTTAISTTTTTTEVPQLPAVAAATSAPEVPSSSTTQAPPLQAAEPSSPTPAQPAPAPEVTTSPLTEAPSSSTTTTTTTQAPVITEAAVNVENNRGTTSEQVDSVRAPINHLPTYESDELHKVLREETTYKNGTVQGKITYVRRANGEDTTTNTHFYSTDSITAPHLVISSVPAVAMLHNQPLSASQPLKPSNQPSHVFSSKGPEPTGEAHGEHHNHPFANLMTPHSRWNPSSNAHQLHQANLHASSNHLFNMKAHLLSKLPLKVLFSNVRHEQ